jgi:hypothetical protein
LHKEHDVVYFVVRSALRDLKARLKLFALEYKEHKEHDVVYFVVRSALRDLITRLILFHAGIYWLNKRSRVKPGMTKNKSPV